MNYRAITLAIAILTCIGTPIGLWIKMQVTDAEHEVELKSHKEMINELKKEVKENRDRYETSMKDLSDKLDAMPQRILDLMNSVDRAKSRN